jgi:hypothetical protein
MRQAYAEAKREDKSSIARKIVDLVEGNGGRFLRVKGDTSNEEFVEVLASRALEKCCQALREDGGKGRSSIKNRSPEHLKLRVKEEGLGNAKHKIPLGHSKQVKAAVKTAVKASLVQAAVKSGSESSVKKVTVATKSVGAEKSSLRKAGRSSNSTLKSSAQPVKKAPSPNVKLPAPIPRMVRKRRSTLWQQNRRRRAAAEDEKSEDNTIDDSRHSNYAKLPGMNESTGSESETLAQSENGNDENDDENDDDDDGGDDDDEEGDFVMRPVRRGKTSSPVDNAAEVKTLPRIHNPYPAVKPPSVERPRHRLSSRASSIFEQAPPVDMAPPIYSPLTDNTPRHHLVSAADSRPLEQFHAIENVPRHRQASHQNTNGVDHPTSQSSFATSPTPVSGLRAPTHRLMMSHPLPNNNQNEDDSSGWLCDFMNGGSSDPTSPSYQSCWEELFVSLVHFKEVRVANKRIRKLRETLQAPHIVRHSDCSFRYTATVPSHQPQAVLRLGRPLRKRSTLGWRTGPQCSVKYSARFKMGVDLLLTRKRPAFAGCKRLVSCGIMTNGTGIAGVFLLTA